MPTSPTMAELTAHLVFVPLGYGPNVAADVAGLEVRASVDELEAPRPPPEG